jgi:hypothetical protein
MTRHSNPSSPLTEDELFDELTHSIPTPSEDHRNRRIRGLEELFRRISSNTLEDKDKSIKILLDMAKIQGDNRPESSIITKSFVLIINKYEEGFQKVLDGLGGKEGRLFLCFSNVVLKLDYKKKKRAIPILINFLMSRDSLNGIGIKEVYNCLIFLGEKRLSQEIVKAASSYLNSSLVDTCAII